MIGIILGLGFQWWPVLQEPWQYVAFIFVYFDIVDYWIDYSPSLKKWPPKREIDVLLDLSIVFVLFFYIYSTQLTLFHFFASFILLKMLDYLWLVSSNYEYRPQGRDKLFMDTWIKLNLMEAFVVVLLILAFFGFSAQPLLFILLFIFFRVGVRIFASNQYKSIHFS
jgi:hypothetical protein